MGMHGNSIINLVQQATSDVELLNELKVVIEKLNDTPEDKAAFKADLQMKDDGHNTALRLMVENDFTSTLEYLVNKAHLKDSLIDVLSIQDGSGFTPINIAVADKKNDIAKILVKNILANSADLNVILSIGDEFGVTPLKSIIDNDDAELFEYFASQSAESILTRLEGDNQQSPAQMAAAGDKAGIIIAIGKIAGKDIDLLKRAFTSDEGKNNPLHWAVEGKAENAVKAIIKVAKQAGLLKELLEEQNASLETPLHLAISNEGESIAKFLIEEIKNDFKNLNATLHIKNEYGNTPYTELLGNSHFKTLSQELLDIVNLAVNKETDNEVCEVGTAVNNQPNTSKLSTQISENENIRVNTSFEFLPNSQVNEVSVTSDSYLQNNEQSKILDQKPADLIAAKGEEDQNSTNESYKDDTTADNNANISNTSTLIPIKGNIDKTPVIKIATNVRDSGTSNIHGAILGRLQKSLNEKLEGTAWKNHANKLTGGQAVNTDTNKQAQFKHGSFTAAQILEKVPQLIKDMNYITRGSGYDIGQVVKIEEDGLFISSLPLGAGVTMSVVSGNPVPAINAVLKTNTGYSIVQDYLVNPVANFLSPYLGNDAEYKLVNSISLIGTTTLGYCVGGGYLAAFNLGFQGLDLGLDYAISNGYISENNAIVNYALKPALGLSSQLINVAYSPSKVLQGIELLHLVREGYGYYNSYQDSFKITEDQFPMLNKLGYSAIDLLNTIRATTSNNEEVRISYNSKITEVYNTHFKEKASLLHCNGLEIDSTLAKEASSVRNELKSLHHLVTSIAGRVVASSYKLYEYSTPGNPTYEFYQNKGKSDFDIFYASFKTNGGNIGLKNNGFDEAISLSNQLNINGTLSIKIYPENIIAGAMDCINDNKQYDTVALVDEICKEYFDFSCSVSVDV